MYRKSRKFLDGLKKKKEKRFTNDFFKELNYHPLLPRYFSVSPDRLVILQSERKKKETKKKNIGIKNITIQSHSFLKSSRNFRPHPAYIFIYTYIHIHIYTCIYMYMYIDTIDARRFVMRNMA